MTTIKKTDRSKYYEHHGAPKKEPEIEDLCPLTRKECLGKRCRAWDGDYNVCGMSPRSLYNQVRDAVTDAAVQVIGAYGEGRALL